MNRQESYSNDTNVTPIKKGQETMTIKLSPLKSIRAKCVECSAGKPSEIRDCTVIDCPLFPYRLGKNPNRKGIGKGRAEFTEKTFVEQGILEK